jgi:hypothetical protein
MDATGLDFNWDASSHEEPPNADAKLFYDMLEATDEPSAKGCANWLFTLYFHFNVFVIYLSTILFNL